MLVLCLSRDAQQEFMELVHARARRRMSRGLKRKPMALIKRLRKAKKSEFRGVVKYQEAFEARGLMSNLILELQFIFWYDKEKFCMVLS